MVADYRILWADIKTPNVIQGELPVEQVAWSNYVKAPGMLRFALPLDPYGPFATARRVPIEPTAWYVAGDDEGADLYFDRAPTPKEARALTRTLFGPSSFGTARTVAYIERGGVIVKGGIIWTNRANVENDSLISEGEGWHSFFREQLIVSTLRYSSIDQDQIIRNIVNHVQGQGGGDIGIDTSDTNPHGVTRDRTYYWHDGKNAGEAMEDLANVGGFDFDYLSGYDSNGDIATRLITRYPPEGRLTEHVFEVGTNVALVDYTEEGKSVRTAHRAFGAGFGTEVRTADAYGSTAVYPLLRGASSHPDVVTTATLSEHADRGLQRGAEPTQHITLQVYPDQLPKLGSYEVGDRVRVSADRGYLQLDRAWFRIVGQEVDVSQDQGETSTVYLSPLGVFG